MLSKTAHVTFEHEDQLILVKITLLPFEDDFFDDKIDISKSVVMSSIIGTYTLDKPKTKPKKKRKK